MGSVCFLKESQAAPARWSRRAPTGASLVQGAAKSLARQRARAAVDGGWVVLQWSLHRSAARRFCCKPGPAYPVEGLLVYLFPPHPW
ncbi:hypothetical protein AOLI_G00228670 [Acnodon oligacanthus]